MREFISWRVTEIAFSSTLYREWDVLTTIPPTCQHICFKEKDKFLTPPTGFHSERHEMQVILFRFLAIVAFLSHLFHSYELPFLWLRRCYCCWFWLLSQGESLLHQLRCRGDNLGCSWAVSVANQDAYCCRYWQSIIRLARKLFSPLHTSTGEQVCGPVRCALTVSPRRRCTRANAHHVGQLMENCVGYYPHMCSADYRE